MSTEQSVEQQLIEQTRSQIRGLVAEIARLSKSDVSPLEFYTEFLNRVVSALAAVGGAVWMTGGEGGLELQYQINLAETNLAGNQQDQQRHGRLLYQVMKSGEGTLIAPRSGSPDDDEAGNPTDLLLVLGPVRNDQSTQGVIEVFQRPNAAPTAQRGYLKFLLQMCDLASDYLKARRLRDFSDRQAVWLQLEQFTRAAHASLDPKQTAYTIANEGRRLIDCDRVSVAIQRGRKCTIEAVSGQDLFDKRSNTVILLGELATAVVATGEPVWYTGDTSDMPPQVEEAVQAYVDESHSKTVAVLPLIRPQPEKEHEEERTEVETIGALIVEQIDNARLGEGMLRRVDVVTEHSSSALANALEHQNLFLMPLWRALGKSTWVVKGRTLPKTISIALAVVALLVALFVIPYDLDLKGSGKLEPQLKKHVYAAVDGEISNVPVEHGDLVQEGTLLVEMRNTDLEAEQFKISGERDTARQTLEAVIRSLTQGQLSRPDETKFRGQQLELEAKLAAYDEQLRVLKEKLANLKLESPIDGQVVTWDIRNLLAGRAIQRGQLLVTVADPGSEWKLEIMMPEDRMGHVTRAQLDPELGKELPVRYILGTDSNTTYYGRVVEVHNNAEVRGEEGNTVLIRATIDPRQVQPLRELMQEKFGLAADASGEDFRRLVMEKLKSGELSIEECYEKTGLRLGATATAKVHCGRASIGYVWFHDAIAWIQRMWFTIW
jgi:multidrug efflux pump subunit AcrA (membrane-fusion protein)